MSSSCPHRRIIALLRRELRCYGEQQTLKGKLYLSGGQRRISSKVSQEVSTSAGFNPNSPSFFQTNVSDHSIQKDIKVEGKAVDIVTERKDVLRELLFNAQKNIEESEMWKSINFRYPGIKSQQVTLVAVLQVIIDNANDRGIALSTSELKQLHTMFTESDRDGQKGLLWTSRFQRSSVAYALLLKYAHKARDAKALKMIAREALIWKNSQRHYSRGNIGIRNRSIHPRVAAADDLSRLIRNLFVSLAVSQRARINYKAKRLAPGVYLPSSTMGMERGDDAMTVSALIRQRIGVYSVKKDEDGKPELVSSRLAKDSRYPLMHTSRARRRLNLLIERGELRQAGKHLSRFTGATRAETKALRLPPILSDNNGVDQELTKITTEIPMMVSPKATPKNDLVGSNENMRQMLTQYKPDTILGQKMLALLHDYEKWYMHLSKRLEVKKSLAATLWHFKLSPRTVTQDDLDAIKQTIPAWLLLSILRIHIQTGDRKGAETVVGVYLTSHRRIHNSKALIEILPHHKERVHAITSPITPPNSASLLNSILRAALTSGSADCFEDQVSVMERWCFHGEKLRRYVFSEKGVDSNKHTAGKGLLPDSTSVMLMLEALQNRKKRFSLGVRLIEDMWRRWGVIGVRNERPDFIELNIHEKLVIPIRAFIILMKWAMQDKLLSARQKKITRIQAMYTDWIAKISKIESNTVKISRDDIAAWQIVNKEAQVNLSQD